MPDKNKKEISELKRLESLKKRENLLKQKSLTISNSLKEVTKNSKLIKFEESTMPENKIKLFKNDSDVSDFEEAFNVKNINLKNKSLQFQNKVNDNRFKIDANFLDPDNADEEKFEDNDAIDEKTHNLAILNSIIKVKPVKRNKIPFKDIEQFRYDPDALGHQRFEVENSIKEIANNGNNKKHKKNKSVDSKVPTSSQPIVSKERFSEINSNLKESFKTDKKFILSALFDEEDYVKESRQNAATSLPQGKDILSTNIFSDSSEEEELIESKAAPIVKTLQSISEIKQSNKFYFMKDDSRLATNFYRTADVESLKADWLSKRKYYVDAYRKRKKQYREYSKTSNKYKK